MKEPWRKFAEISGRSTRFHAGEAKNLCEQPHGLSRVLKSSRNLYLRSGRAAIARCRPDRKESSMRFLQALVIAASTFLLANSARAAGPWRIVPPPPPGAYNKQAAIGAY